MQKVTIVRSLDEPEPVRLATQNPNFLDDPLTHISPPLIWEGWEAYYPIMHYEGARSANVN